MDEEVIDTSGFVPDANLPGDSQGETNGLYASMTENTVDTDGRDYLDANPGGKTDFLGGLLSALDGAGKAASRMQTTATQLQRNKARADYERAHGYRPTLVEQWEGLDTFTKFGFLAAVFGIYWALAHKG